MHYKFIYSYKKKKNYLIPRTVPLKNKNSHKFLISFSLLFFLSAIFPCDISTNKYSGDISFNLLTCTVCQAV